ncbi:MAG: DUF1294 domain-containing protein [Woeseiaceae bacterium]|nr:DUF1294 domain-containing protein [Woeseiaceae bacterium]
MRNKGKITSWDDDKGFGFITPLAGGKRIFIHISALGKRYRRPALDDVVTYSLSKDAQGRPRAARAKIVGGKSVATASRMGSSFAIATALAFLAAIAAGVATKRLAENILIGYVALSFIAFIAYALDKSAAKRGAWRTSEKTLLLLGLAGGWPGSLIAQQTLRHKSKKASFRFMFWITVLMNCAALAWIHTEGGREATRGLFT